MDYTKISKEITEYINQNLSKKRLNHTMGVVKMAKHLAEINDVDVNTAELCALAHDMHKELSKDEVKIRIEKYNLDKKYLEDIHLVHGKLAAITLSEKYGIKDSDILNAVSYHTTGRFNMSKLEKIIYLSDAIEENRDYPLVQKFREIAEIDLDMACLKVLERTVEYLNELGQKIDIDTLDAIKYIKGGSMENTEFVNVVTNVLLEKKAENIKVIDIREKASFADYFILATGSSERQINNLVDYIEDELAKNGLFIKSVEGKMRSGWILCDFGDLVVNLFTPEYREKYNLEKVWGDCPITNIE